MSSGEDPSVLARADPTHHQRRHHLPLPPSAQVTRSYTRKAWPGKAEPFPPEGAEGFWGQREKKKSMPRGAVSESSKLRKGRANAQGSASPRLRTCPASSRPAGALRDSGNGTANRGQTRSPTPGRLTYERDQRGPKPSTNRGLTGIPGGPRKVWQVAKDGTHLMFG